MRSKVPFHLDSKQSIQSCISRLWLRFMLLIMARSHMSMGTGANVGLRRSGQWLRRGTRDQPVMLMLMLKGAIATMHRAFVVLR